MYAPTVEPSETTFHPQIRCVWITGTLIARSFNPAVPATQAEVLALAADGGMPPSGELPNGSHGNYARLYAAMQKRYGLIGELHTSANPAAAQLAVLEAARTGTIAVALAGDMYNLTPHWQNGHVGHSIAVLYDHSDIGIQFDPLAPLGYAGDPFPPAELNRFATAALIFTEESMPGFKSTGPVIGSFKMLAGGFALVSPSDPKLHYPQPAGGTFAVYSALDLKTPAGVAIDIDGHSPPLNKRDQVYLVDAPAFGAAAYALRTDGTFTATDCSAEVAKATAPLNARISAAKTALG